MRQTTAPSESPGSPGLRRLGATALVASLVAGLLGIVAVTAVTVTPDVAGASTTAVAATWSPTPACNGTTYATASPPAGALSATVVLNGAGGGGGGHGSGTGGTGAKLTGTFNLTHATGSVAVNIGCGGAGGGTVNPVGCCSSQTVGGGGGGAAVDSGFSGGNAQVIDAGLYPGGSGGGGGGGSRLCLGTTSCTTQVADAGGGGGSGGSGNNTSSGGAGGGGGSAGASGSSGGGGGAAGTSSSTGSAGGNSGNNEVSGGGGGGGGGAGPGNGGGGCGKVSGSCGGGGGGGGFSKANASYYSSAPTVTVAGGAGGGQQAAGTAGSVSLTWNVDNLSVTNPGSQSSVTGSAISALAISAAYDTTGGNTVTYAATGLPAGLSISPSTGAITGTPTTPGSSSVTVTVTDSQALSTSTSFTWTTTNTVTVANPGAKSSVTGTAISAVTNSATDSQSGATLTWSATGLPAGLSISPTTGTVTGTPTTPCTCSVTVQATDGAAFSGTASFSWTVTNSVHVTTPGDQSSVSGSAITPLVIGATDSQAGVSLAWSATGLPAGLSINSSTGTITGTPTTAGISTVVVEADDPSGPADAVTVLWTVSNHVTVTGPGPRSSVSGSPVSPVSAVGSDSSSTTTLTWSGSGLPVGLSIDATTGTITGTPTTAGTSSVTLTAQDGAGYSADTTFTWTVTNTVTLPSPGSRSSVSGSPVTPLAVTGSDSSSTATLAYSVTGLPPGLSIDASTGTVTGTPTIAGTFPVTVTASDGAGFSATASFTWTITNTLTMTDPGDQSSVSGTAIAPLGVPTTDSVSGAVLAFADGGTLPPGLSLDPATGDVSGTPTTAGTYPVTVTATDDSGFSAQVSFTWTVTNTVTVTDPGDRTTVSGTAVTPVAVAATDSSPVATLGYAATGLPAGVSIAASTGIISGTPTTAGTYTVTVTVTDSAGFTGSTTFPWTVTNTITVHGPGNRTTVSGSAVAPVTVGATDSSSTATLSVGAGGTLPPGLSINPTTGTISGTPTTGGTFAVTVTWTDTAGSTGTVSFTWTVTDTVTVTGPGDQTSRVGVAIIPVTESSTDTSSTVTRTWSATGLPTGLTISPSTGTISGATLHSGVFAVTVTVTDSAGYHASTSFTWSAVGAAVTSVTKSAGPGAGGVKVTIKGSDLTGATSVVFGSVPAVSFSVNKAGTKITAYTPVETAGTVDVIVTTPQGPSLATAADRYTFLAPAVSGLSATSGLTTGGRKVVISGSGFQGATAVHFGTVAASGFTVNKAGTKITVLSPAQSAGQVDVTVTTPGGTSPTGGADLFIVS